MNGHIDGGPTSEHLLFMLTVKLVATHVYVLVLWTIQQLMDVSLCIKYICFMPFKLFIKGECTIECFNIEKNYTPISPYKKNLNKSNGHSFFFYFIILIFE
jgi:hypothetical protein